MMELADFSVTDICIKNKLDLNQVRLEINTSHAVRNIADQQKCECETSITITPDDTSEDESGFKVFVCIESEFSYDEKLTHKEMHIQTFDIISPFIQAIVSTAMSNAMMPPLFLSGVSAAYKKAVESGSAPIK